MEQALERAARAVAGAEALVVCAGAGMGVDSGLPDFRGNEGFWKAYPPFAKLGLGFMSMANPSWFQRDPHLAWGFYGHRLNLYRATVPHQGFAILRRWGEGMAGGCAVFTSNVDGQFHKAGFDPDLVEECHGSILHMQCVEPCCPTIWDGAEVTVTLDESTMRADDPLPACPACGAVARPNVLMFGDWAWLSERSSAQSARFRTWVRERHGRPMVVVELGAGTAVPTVRYTAEHLARFPEVTLVRINPREPQVPAGEVSLPMGGLAALRAIDQRVQALA